MPPCKPREIFTCHSIPAEKRRASPRLMSAAISLEDLPPYTSRETASILRDKVWRAKKFVLLTTVNSKDSRWVPWELGLSDGYKRGRSIAIFPSPETASDVRWTEREYLGVYDRIVNGALQGRSGNVWMVWNQEKNTATELADWLKS